MKKAFFIKITGDVQGVNFRYFTQKEAQKLNLSGWARNEHDGSVLIFVQGEEEVANKMIEWAREGSPMAEVEKVDVEEVEVDDNLRGFSVK